MHDKREFSILGKIGKDIEILNSKNGKRYGKILIATNDIINDKKITNWFSCLFYKDDVLKSVENLKKGDLVLAEGKLSSATKIDSNSHKTFISCYQFDLIINKLIKKEKNPEIINDENVLNDNGENNKVASKLFPQLNDN